jgi:hypothetical protein
MKTSSKLSIISQYKKYVTYGAASLLASWLMALLTTAILPGPYHFDFFGVVAEKTAASSTVTVGWVAFVSAFLFLPLIMMAVDYFKNRFND